MKIWDVVKCGLQDLKAHKSKNRISFMLIFLAIVVYIGVNSTMESIERGGYDIVNGTVTRSLVYEDDDKSNEEKLSYAIDKFGNDKRVKNIFLSWGDYLLMTETEEFFGIPSYNVREVNFFKEILDYDYKGEKKEPAYDEVILPRYFYDIGVYTEYSCANSDELIGKTITFKSDRSGAKYDMKVIGTYNNITHRVGWDEIYVNEEFSIDCKKDYYLYVKGQKYNENPPANVIILLEYGYNSSEVCEEFHNIVYYESDMSGAVFQKIQRSEEVVGYNNYIITIGNMVSLMLLFVAVVNIMISSISEVNLRKWEFALKMSMGYRKRYLVAIFAVEKIANALKALMVSVLVLWVYSTVLTYYYQNIEVYWKRGYMISISGKNVLFAMILSVVAALTGVFVSRLIIRNVKIAKALKSEG